MVPPGRSLEPGSARLFSAAGPHESLRTAPVTYLALRLHGATSPTTVPLYSGFVDVIIESVRARGVQRVLPRCTITAVISCSRLAAFGRVPTAGPVIPRPGILRRVAPYTCATIILVRAALNARGRSMGTGLRRSCKSLQLPTS